MFLKRKVPLFSLMIPKVEKSFFLVTTNEYTHCNVGTIPLPDVPVAPGVAAGVAGVTPLPFAAFPPCGCPFTTPFAFWPSMAAPFSDDGGVKSEETPGNDREAGEVKALACCGLAGWVVSESIVT